jgi:predicted XRE-type DNA-binding protein
MTIPYDIIHPGSTNVFADLELENPDALLMKAQITGRILNILAERRINQAEAASLLDLSEQTLRDMQMARLDVLSLERLLTCLVALGHRATLTFEGGDNQDDFHLTLPLPDTRAPGDSDAPETP